MIWQDKPLFCAGCGAEISVGAVIHQGKTYCCQDCLEGRPCDCGERMEFDDGHSGKGIPPSLLPS